MCCRPRARMVLFEPIEGWAVGAEECSSLMYSSSRAFFLRRAKRVSSASASRLLRFEVGMAVGVMRGGL